MKVYKATDKDMKCRGLQYQIGTPVEEKEADLCNKGLHACTSPLDVLRYYEPGKGSRYFEAEAEEVSDKKGDDSKIVCKKLTMGAEIGLPGLAKAHVEYVMEQLDKSVQPATNTGNRSAATNTGDYSAATNTGDQSAATNTGDCSAATNTGNRSAATNTGDYSAATNTGYQSAATNTGDYSAAINTGDRSAATNTGDCSAATNTGDYSAATNTGDCSTATVDGKDSIAVASGYHSKAKACLGSAICLFEHGDWNGETYPLLSVKAAIVDGVNLKPNVFYMLVNGEFQEVE